jgi:hypothetical protein
MLRESVASLARLIPYCVRLRAQGTCSITLPIAHMAFTKYFPLVILLVLLLGANQCLAQTPGSPGGSSCSIGEADFSTKVVPQLRFLQQILDKNFSEPPPAPTVTVTQEQGSVSFSVDVNSWATDFRVNHYAEVALVAPAVVTTMLPAIKDFFNYRAQVVLSSSNFVPNTRYFYSAISLRSHLNQQSRPSELKFFDYLPQFAIATLEGTIAADKTPMQLDVSFRNFEPSVVITLISPNSTAVNLTYRAAPADGTVGRLSTIFVARVEIPSLIVGGAYTLRFELVRTGFVISRPLTVLAPFRPRFETVLPSTLPLAGGSVRVLISRVIYPIVLASTVIVNSSGVVVSTASFIEASASGPQDFFVTFNLATPVGATSTVGFTIIPNGEPKAFLNFNIMYSAVRLLSTSPSTFTNRPSRITVTIAVDSGTPSTIGLELRRNVNTPTPITISDPVGSGMLTSALSFAPVAPGVFAIYLNFAAGSIVGHYAASLSVNIGAAPSVVVTSLFEVQAPLPPAITILPPVIYDDTEYAVSVTVSNIGDIQSSSNLITTCNATASCRCTVLQFSISFASLNCLVRSAPATITVNVNNTNSAGFGQSISATFEVLRSTTPRFVKASSNVFHPFGRFPLAFAVANMDVVNDIKIFGISIPASSFMTLRVTQPFDIARLGTLQNAVRSTYSSESAFLSAFDSVAFDFITNFAFNATICVLRMPMSANVSVSQSLVEILQTSPSAQVSFPVSFVSVSANPFVRVSVPQISLGGGTAVSVDIRNYIPITQVSDVDIVFVAQSGNSTTEVSVNPMLRQVSSVEATFSFISPVLSTTADVEFKIISKIDSLFGRSNASGNATQIVPFTLPVFDPRRLTVQSFSQRTVYSIGGPRIVTFFVSFLKAVPVAVTVNLLECEVLSSPTATAIKLEPNRQFAITVEVKNFVSTLTGDVPVLIFSGNEQANATLNVITPPSVPVLVAQQGTDRIPSNSSRRVTVSFRNFIASANTSNFMVLFGSGKPIMVNSADITSDFTLTTVSFTVEPIGALNLSEPFRNVVGSVVDFSSLCGRNLTCVGNFTLQYVNADLPSFVVMSPTVGASNVETSAVILINNVLTSNISLITAEISSPNVRFNVSVSVLRASLSGPGISSQSSITVGISWTSFPRPSFSPVEVRIRLRMGAQILDVPTAFTVLPDNRPQLLSISPKAVSIDGGAHSSSFVMPTAYGFVSARVFIDGVEVNSTVMFSGAVIGFISPMVPAARSSTVTFMFAGSAAISITDTITYLAPPPVVVTSVFPSDFSSFGSASQVILRDVPRFWSFTSLRASLVSGVISITCQVESFSLPSATANVRCPALEVGFYLLEIFDVSSTSRVARSSSLSVFNPLAPKFRSILPLQIFASKSTQLSVVYDQVPVGAIASLFFIAQGSSVETPVQILSSFIEPSTTSSTVGTFIVDSPVSVAAFTIKLNVRSAIGTVFSTTSPLINTIDDSSAVILSVTPASINSVGGTVEVRLGGYPSGLSVSDVSAALTANGLSMTATSLSFSYADSSRATLLLQFAAIETSVSSSFDVTIRPKGFASKNAIFSLSVVKVFPSVSSVVPSSVLNSGNEIVTLRLAYFPIVTSPDQLSVSISGFTGSLPVSLSSSTADVTVVSVRTSAVSIPSPGNFSLVVSSVIFSSVSISALISIQISESILFINQTSSIPTMRSGSRAFMPFTLFLPFSTGENDRFASISTGMSFAQGSMYRIIVRFPVNDPRSLGSIDQSSTNNLITILRRDFPYRGCITFAVTFISTGQSGTQTLDIFYGASSDSARFYGSVSVRIESLFMSISPSSGAVSGGYPVMVTLSGLPSFSNASLFFGDQQATLISQSPIGSSSALFTVISPSFPSVSDVQVTVRIGGSSVISSMFAVTLGCLDYVSFCRGLSGGFIANTPLISKEPPSGPVCTISYCVALSSIPAPVLLSFPRKQSTTVPTVTFTVRSLFATSASHIRVLAGSDTLLSLQTAVYSLVSDSFVVTVRAPAVSVFSTFPIVVYSSLVGIESNVTFMLTSVPPIVGAVKVASVIPSQIPFEGVRAVTVQVTNFPFTTTVPTSIFVVNASTTFTPLAASSALIVSAVLVSSTESGDATFVVSLRPSLILSGNQNVNVNLFLRAISNSVSEAASVTIAVNPRLPIQIKSVSATRSINSTAFLSVAGPNGALITLEVQGLSDPNVTVCFGFSDPVSGDEQFPNCTVDCVVLINAVTFGSPVSLITVPYPRDFFILPPAPSFFKFSPKYGLLDVYIYNQVIPTAPNQCLTDEVLRDRNIQFKTRAVLTFHPEDVPTLVGVLGGSDEKFAVPVPFAQVDPARNFTLSASELFFTFANFHNPATRNITAFIEANVNVFPQPDSSCSLSLCAVRVLVGGRASDAKFVSPGQIVDIKFASGPFNIVVKTKFVNPAPIVIPSSVSSSGGSRITVTSHAFSQISISASYQIGNSNFSILPGMISKVGSIGTQFVVETLRNAVGDAFFQICSGLTCDTINVIVFPAVILSPPLAISACLNGDRQIQIFASNLPAPLANADSFSVRFNNIGRPYSIVSDSVFNISFPCIEEFPPQVSLQVSISNNGVLRTASSSVNLPVLRINARIRGTNRFPLGTRSTIFIGADTLLVRGEFSFGVSASGKEDVIVSPAVTLIRSDRSSSLFSFEFQATSATPPGSYNFVLTVRSQSLQMAFSVFDDKLVAVCAASSGVPRIVVPTSSEPICAVNAVTGGSLPIQITQSGGFTFSSNDIVLTVSRPDGSLVTALAPSLSNFDTSAAFNVSFSAYTQSSDFNAGVFAAQLAISSFNFPQAKLTVSVAFRNDPQVVDASFGETLSSLLMPFNQPIAVSRDRNCSRLFASATVSRLGVGPSCVFQRNSIFVVFGSGALVVPGDVLAVLPNAVAPADGFLISNPAQFVTVKDIPSSFSVPAVTIAGTDSVEGCASAAPARLTATFPSPRALIVSWSCVFCEPLKPLDSFLRTLSTSVVNIPADVLRNTDCSFGALSRDKSACGIVATVRDFLGRSVASSPFTVYVNPASAPDFQIVPLAQSRLIPSDPISLRSRFKFSLCTVDTGKIPTYMWSMSGPTTLNISLITGPFLNIRSNVLLPGSYTIRASVFIDGLTASDSISFVITMRPLFAVISAPITWSVSQNLTLDAQNSRDLEISITPPIPLLFSWSCFDLNNFPCVDTMNVPLTLPLASSIKVLTIPANTLPMSIDAALPYFFRLSISSNADSRIALAEATVNIVAGTVPRISTSSSLPRVNAGAAVPVVLSAQVENSLSVTWSETSGLLSNFSSIIDPLFTNAQSRIVINTLSLVAGQTYVFTATVNSDRRAFASVSLEVNPPPNSGTCVLSSIVTGGVTTTSCGVADNCNVRTSVTVSCSSWVDAHLPLRYEFGYVSSLGVGNSFDYVTDSTMSLTLPAGLYTMTVSVCDSFFACTFVARVNQVPLNISSARLDSQSEKLLENDIEKSVRSGDVDAFCTLLSSASSYFISSTGSRRLLNTVSETKFANTSASQIALVARALAAPGSDPNPGSSGSLIRASSNLVSNVPASNTLLTSTFVNTLLPSMVTLSGALLKDPENVNKRVTDGKVLVNIIKSFSSFDSVTGNSYASNLVNLRTLENNMLSAVLLGQQAGQSPEEIASSDGTYVARGQKVLLQDRSDQAVSVQSPVLQGSSTPSAKFDVSFSANRVSDVSVRSSVQPKSKWDKLPIAAAASVLLSDLIDCTVIKDGSLVSTSSTGLSRAGVELEFPLSQGTGAGSRDAFLTDKSSFKLMFIDSTGKLNEDGCSGSISEVIGKPFAAKYVGSCNHLTVFGVVGSTPSAVVPPSPPSPGPVIPGPVTPTPVAPPTVTASPSSSEPSATFPVWASVVLAVGGAVIVAAAAVIIKKRKEAFENERVKKIVAASLWKQAYASSAPKDTPNRSSSPQRYSSPAFSPVAVPDKQLPAMNSTPPLKSASSANDMASDPARRRQILADLAGAIDLGEGSGSSAPDNLSRSRKSPSPVKFLADLIELDESSGVSAPVLKPFSSRSRSPFNRDDSRDMPSSLNVSSFKTLRDSGVTADQAAYSRPTSVNIPSPEGSSRDFPFKSRALPRSKSPFTPSNADEAQLFSSVTSSARRDPVASSLRHVGSKTVRQQLADMAAAAAEGPSLEFALPPLARSSPRADYATEGTRARSSSRGRALIPDFIQTSPGPSIGSPSVLRSSRQLMADVAAGDIMGDYEPRDPSPIGRGGVPASRLPRPRSRPILDDPDTMYRSPAPSASFSRNASPRDSRLSPSSLRQPASRGASMERSVAVLPDPFDAAPRAGSSQAPAGFSARKPSQPSRQGGGNRYDQA